MSSKTYRSLALFFGLAFLLSAFSTQLRAQSEAAEPARYIVRVDGLTPADYATIVKALRTEGQTTVSEACIPADLICMSIPAGWTADQSFGQVENVVATKTALQAAYLSAFTINEFREACNDARLGRSGQ